MPIPNLIESLNALAEGERRVFPCHTNRSSSLGDDCERKLVYYRTKWAEQEKPSAELQRRFNLGRLFEDYMLMRLAQAGEKIIRQQEPLNIPEHQITGHPDGNIVDKATGEDYPMDIKSAASSVFYRINEKEDFARFSWTKKYIAQLTLYMHAQQREQGCFLFVDKQSGAEKQININYDSGYVKDLFAKADRINEHVRAKTLPERISYCDDCENCPFRMICLPDVVFKQPEFETDQEIIAILMRMNELKAAHKEYAALEKDLKEERIKPRLAPGTVGEKRQLFIGGTEVNLAWQTRKGYEVKPSAGWVIRIGGKGE